MFSKSKEILFFSSIITLALFLRLWNLGDRPFHHDESMHAFYSLEIARHFVYQYVPFLHGPLLYFLTALSYCIGGVTVFVARSGPAIAGTALCMLPWLIRDVLTVPGALSATILLSLSPTMLYFSRFLRHDIYSALLHAVAFVAILTFQKKKNSAYLMIAMVAMILSFANHELTYISFFMIGIYAAWQCIQYRQWLHVWEFIQHQRKNLLAGLFLVLVAYTLLLTSFGTNLQGFADGLPNPFSTRTSLGYWLSQHQVKRGGQPIYYYLILIVAYEFVILGCFIAACRWFKELIVNPTLRFLFYWSIASLVMYSWAGERMPWLLMHPLLPMSLVAGYGFSKLYEQKKIVLLALLGLLFIISGYFSLRLNFKNSADPRELLVYVQTSPDVLKVTKTIQDYKRSDGQRTQVSIDSELSWPFSWYLRKQRIVGYQNNLRSFVSADLLAADFMLIHTFSRRERPVLPTPWEYVDHYALRSWWVPESSDYNQWSIPGWKNLLHWWCWREVISGEGELVFALYKKASQE
jgi:uncharacterized protein (TIGR03663 family)